MSYLGDIVTKNVEDRLVKMFHRDFKFDIFRKLLKECNAVIAGGSVLSGTLPTNSRYWSKDIDIYVRIEDSKPLLNFLFGNCNHKKFQTGKFANYCETFLSKNGIRCIYRNAITNYLYRTIGIEVMTIRNSKNPVDVVKNFDLSFCQVWYDGDKVFAAYPDDIKTMQGFVTGDYVKPLLNDNTFLVKRYKKYTDRGFKILINLPKEHIIEEDTCLNVKKFKHLSKDAVNKSYPDEKSKKKLIAKFILRILNNFKDDSGYDSDEYDDISKFSEFKKEELSDAIKNYKNAIIKGLTTNPHGHFLLNCVHLFETT